MPWAGVPAVKTPEGGGGGGGRGLGPAPTWVMAE